MCGHPQTTQLESNNGFVSHYGKLFLWVLSCFCIAFAAYLIYANIAFRNSQESIKQSYAQHIAQADSLYWDMISYNKDYVSHVGDVNATILSDSLIRLTLDQKQKLSTEQYNRLQELLSTQFLEIERLHKKNEFEIKLIDINGIHLANQDASTYFYNQQRKQSLEIGISNLKTQRDKHINAALMNALTQAEDELTQHSTFSSASLLFSNIRSFLTIQNIRPIVSLPVTLKISLLNSRLQRSIGHASLKRELMNLKMQLQIP